MSNQRRTVQNALLKQPNYNPQKDYAPQMAAFYESRIAAAADAKALEGIRQDILNHQKENRRYRRRTGIFANAGAVVAALVCGAGGALVAAAATASMVSGAVLIDIIIIGSITYATGYIVFESAKALFQMEQEANKGTEAENSALTALENKLQLKLSPASPPAAEAPAAAGKLSLLGRLRSFFGKAAEKPADSAAAPVNAASPAQKPSA